MKLMKQILRDLDFYHCYGIWISRDTKNIRCKLLTTNGEFYFIFSNNGGRTYSSNNTYCFGKRDNKEKITSDLLEILTDWV
jgi:hypothetical protein